MMVATAMQAQMLMTRDALMIGCKRFDQKT